VLHRQDYTRKLKMMAGFSMTVGRPYGLIFTMLIKPEEGQNITSKGGNYA
jgi:hypothetical protein